MHIAEFLFGDMAPTTEFTKTVCDVFLRNGLESDSDCWSFVLKVSQHRLTDQCKSLFDKELIVDSLCGLGAYDYLLACDSNKLNGYEIDGFTAEEISIDKEFVKEVWGFYTGCNNEKVYAAFYRWAVRMLSAKYGCIAYADMVRCFTHVLWEDSEEQTLSSLMATKKTANFPMDELDKMFPIEQIDEQQLRLNYVIECVKGQSSNPYKDLVIKYLDVLEQLEMTERAR